MQRIKDHFAIWAEEYFYASIIIIVLILIIGGGMLKCRATGIDHWESYSPCWGCRNQPIAVCKKE